MAIELPVAVETPLFLVQVRPVASDAVVSQQVQLLIIRKGDVSYHNMLGSNSVSLPVGARSFREQLDKPGQHFIAILTV
jgi:hypothetical protein